MEEQFRAGRYTEAVDQGVRAVGDLLMTHSPRTADEPNELSDKPIVL
jgi:uncharacterized membrane protein